MGAVREGVRSPISPPQLWSKNWLVPGSSVDPARGPVAWSPAVSVSFPGWHSAPHSALLGVGGAVGRRYGVWECAQQLGHHDGQVDRF